MTETPQREEGGRDPLSRACWELGAADLAEAGDHLGPRGAGRGLGCLSEEQQRLGGLRGRWAGPEQRSDADSSAAVEGGLQGPCAQEGCQPETGATSQSPGWLAVGSRPLTHSLEGPG